MSLWSCAQLPDKRTIILLQNRTRAIGYLHGYPHILRIIKLVLNPYEIAQNNQQTTYQSKLHTKVQSNSICYNDLFVFVLIMIFIRVTGG